MFTKTEIGAIDRKMDTYLKSCLSKNGYGKISMKMLVNYAQTIAYDEAHRDTFLREGLRQNLLTKVHEYSRPYHANREGVPMSSTTANQGDVRDAEELGFELKRGDIIHKDLLKCTKKQLTEAIRRWQRDITPRYKEGAYLIALYELRFNEQYKLPFDIPVNIQVEMKRQAAIDLAEAS